jgi:hypothetical protein
MSIPDAPIASSVAIRRNAPPPSRIDALQCKSGKSAISAELFFRNPASRMPFYNDAESAISRKWLRRRLCVISVLVLSIEASVRSFLWICTGYYVQRPQIPCAEYPFGFREPFTPGYEVVAAIAIGAVASAPVFIAAVLLLRKILADPAIRAFAAGSACELARFALAQHMDAARGDLCANPMWSMWGWGPTTFLAGAAAVVAHWLISRGLGSVIARAEPPSTSGADRR